MRWRAFDKVAHLISFIRRLILLLISAVLSETRIFPAAGENPIVSESA